jgi:NAD(P)H dehydrogenase (quinone)
MVVGHYAVSSALQRIGRTLETGTLVAPEDGPVSWTSHPDLVEAAVIALTDEEYKAGLISRGVPEPRAELLVGLFRASRKGEFAAVDPTLERLLGRPPMALREVLKARLAEGFTTFF